MYPNKKVTLNSYNFWLKSQKQSMTNDEKVFHEANPENQTKFTLIKFNRFCFMSEYNDIKTAPELDENSYKPNDITALYDAIGAAITRYSDEKNNVCVVITDGYENASTRFSQNKIKRLIKK